MKILIVGAGRIGSSVAESLVSEANDITVVDQDAERIGSLQSRFDLRGVVGNATSPQVLTDAGAADTDMLIAVTLSLIHISATTSFETIPAFWARKALKQRPSSGPSRRS